MSRGQRLVDLVKERDCRILQQLNQPNFETTKSVNVKSLDIVGLKNAFFPVLSNPTELPKPVAFVSPIKNTSSAQLPSEILPNNVINFPSTSRIATSEDNANRCKRRLNGFKTLVNFSDDENIQTVAVRKSKRLKQNKYQAVKVNTESNSDDESAKDPFDDSESEYCPSPTDADDSCSDTGSILRDNTGLEIQQGTDSNIKNAEEKIIQPKVELQTNSGTVKGYNDEDSSSCATTIISNTTDGNSISDFGFNFNSDSELETQFCPIASKENILQSNKKRPEILTLYNPKGTKVVIEEDLKPKDICQNVVTVSLSTKRDGKIVRDKGHACYFCQKIFCNNLARHLELKHSNEMEVAKILAMPKSSKRRRDEFINLTRYGDFYFNCDVLTLKCGELILTRRPPLQQEPFLSYFDYGPCPECLGFFVKKHIWHHLKYKCTSKLYNSTEFKVDSAGKGVIAESNALLNGILGSNLTTSFITHIVNNFKNDNISKRCKEDQTIMRYGAFLYEKYSSTQSELIRQSMRQLGRLSLEMKKNGEVFENLGEVLIPDKFDAIVNATKTLCMATNEDFTKRPEFGIPSLALKIGYGIKKCTAIERGQSLRRGDLRKNKDYMAFLSLLKLEWSVKISSNALTTLHMRKKNAADLLPITSDLVKLSNFLESEIKKIKENLSSQNYSKLASLTLSRIILFNKRRSGEVARMTLSQYSSRPKWQETGTEEMKKSLTPFENKLASALTIVKVIGKRGRIVPIILTKDMKDSLDMLVFKRVQHDILSENPFVFAIKNTKASHMRGHDCLNKWCNEAGLTSPELVSSTKLRKYVATVCQVFDLSENEYDWLARHLGHDVRVHREFYRLQENAVELTKVSRLLLAVDQGEAHKFSGKKLDDINIEDLDGIYDKEDDLTQSKNHVDGIYDREDDLTQSKNHVLEEMEPRKDKKKLKEKKFELDDKVSKNTSKAKTKKCDKRPWLREEKEILLAKFKYLIKTKSLPGKCQCMEVMNEYKIFSGRKWTDLKFFIKNHLAKINKVTGI